MERLKSIKNENDLYKISISEPINDLIMYLSIVSREINKNSNAKIIFLYNHLKSLVKSKLSVITINREQYLPEKFINFFLNFYPISESFDFLYSEPTFRCIPWGINEREFPFATKLEIVETTTGGTCLLHAILLGLSPLLQRFPYIDTYKYRTVLKKNQENRYYKKNDINHYDRYSREYFGNAYRIKIARLDIFDTTEKESLNINNIEGNLNPDKNITFYVVPPLNIEIGEKLLDYLKYNLIVIDGTNKSIFNSPYNKLDYDKYIIIFQIHQHFELVKIKDTNKTIYTRDELKELNIFNEFLFYNDVNKRNNFKYNNEPTIVFN